MPFGLKPAEGLVRVPGQSDSLKCQWRIEDTPPETKDFVPTPEFVDNRGKSFEYSRSTAGASV